VFHHQLGISVGVGAPEVVVYVGHKQAPRGKRPGERVQQCDRITSP
jgi:hypothetical protein